jgi:chromosome partitioning protein
MMPSKIICVSNNKGGTGKTTIAVIIAQTAIEEGMQVAICDLDYGQQDFKEAMTVWQCEIIENIDALKKTKKDSKNSFVVVDTPPALGGEKDEALNIADIILVPISHTIRALKSVMPIATRHNVKIVLNLLNPTSSLERKIVATSKKFFDVLGVVKQYARIRSNITDQNPWYMGLSEIQKQPYIDLLGKVANILK